MCRTDRAPTHTLPVSSLALRVNVPDGPDDHVVDVPSAFPDPHVAEDVPSLGEPPDDGSRRPFAVRALAGRVLVHEMPYEQRQDDTQCTRTDLWPHGDGIGRGLTSP